MNLPTLWRVWLFLLLIPIPSYAAIRARVGGDFKSYDYYDRESFGGTATVSYTKSAHWAIRLGGYGRTRFGETSGQAAAGASYWITPAWIVEVDGDVSTYSNILPLFSGTLSTGITIADAITPAVAFQLAQYSDALSFVFNPSISWSIIPQIEVSAKLYAGLTGFINGKSAGTISGAAKVTAAPFDYFSIYVGTSIGEEPFDPGDPSLPLSSFFAQHFVAGIRCNIAYGFGAEINIDREWRTNGKNIVAGDFSLFYDW